MRIESKLCHISENKAVVLVNGWVEDKNVGSALAEATTVEDAEDKAISRLHKRLNIFNGKEQKVIIKNDKVFNKPSAVELPISNKINTVNVDQDPSDWSNELASIDIEIERLNWSREDEVNFLEKNFGYNNRNKITKYSDLLNYLSLLKKNECITSSNFIKDRISKMIKETDIILMELSWDHKQGREYLQKEFNVSTRKELDEKQLMSFLEKLKSIRNQYLLKKNSSI